MKQLSLAILSAVIFTACNTGTTPDTSNNPPSDDSAVMEESHSDDSMTMEEENTEETAESETSESMESSEESESMESSDSMMSDDKMEGDKMMDDDHHHDTEDHNHDTEDHNHDDDNMMEAKDDQTMEAKTAAATYSEFSQSEYQANLGQKPQVLYFHATWCPTCLKLEERVKSDISSFPEGTTILQADYDTETELKKQYGVKKQTTLVVLNKDGSVSETLVNPSNAKLKAAIDKTL